MNVTFDQLPESLQQEAIDTETKFRREDNDWWDSFILDEWKVKLAKMGFDDAQINYSGFSSQGDGASFICKHVNICKFLRWHKGANEYRTLYNYLQEGGYVDASLYRSDHHYCHEYTVSANIDFSYYGEDSARSDRLDDQVNRFEDWLVQEQRNLAKQIYHELKEEYFQYTDDDNILQYLKDQDFEVEGELVLKGFA